MLPALDYGAQDAKPGKYHPPPSRPPRPFYLKYHSRYLIHSLFCLEFWLEVARCSGDPVYIVCDEPQFKSQIQKRILSPNSSVEFIPSDRQSFAREIRSSFTPSFVNTAFALLTPLLHAQRLGFAEFWNIDADDILYYCAPSYLSQCLEHIAGYALSQGIDLYSQDVHTSLNRTGNYPWSFGVTFSQSHGCLRDMNWFMSHLQTPKWQACCQAPPRRGERLVHPVNIDLYVTHCARELGILTARTFNIEQVLFTHLWFPAILGNPQMLIYGLRMAHANQYLLPLQALLGKRLPSFPINPAFTDVLCCTHNSARSLEYYLSYTAALMSEQPFRACKLPASPAEHDNSGF